MKKYLYLSVSMAVICASNVAFAQENTTKDQEVIIVTAQKRAQDLQKTPLSITAVRGSELVAMGKTSFADALKDVPGVQIQSIAQGAQVFIRGVGSSIDPGFADPSVALMADGVYNGRSETIEGGGFDIDRVEVLRGPQGTIYGRNATGGAVNIISANPKISETTGYARIGGGNYGLSRGEFALNLPLGSIVALRLSGLSEQHKSYIDNGGMDENVYGLRAKILYKPNQKFSLLGKYEYFENSGFGANNVPVAGSAGQLTFPPPLFTTNFNPTIVGGPPFTGGFPIWRFPNGWLTADSSDPWANDSTHPGGSIRRVSSTYLMQMDLDVGFGTLTILPSYTKQRSYMYSSLLFGNLVPFTAQNIGTTYKSVEARLSSNPDSNIAWLLGVYYLDSNTPNELLSVSAGGGFTSDQTFDPNVTTAVFGQITYPLSDNLRGTLGLRYSSDEQGGSFQIVGSSFDSGLKTYSQKQESTTFKLGFEYDLAQNSLLYGHIASGFKQGGFNATVPATVFEPEKLLAYEIGVKNRFYDNKLMLNLSAFIYDYDNYQIASFRSVSLGTTGDFVTAMVITNAEATQISGLELQSIWRATDNDVFRFSYNLLNAEYGKASLANNPFVNQGEYSLEGRQAANSPEWTATIGYTHSFDLQDAQIDVGFDTKLSAGYFTTSEVYLPGAWQDSYTRTDANIRYRPKNQSYWNISGFIKNIENNAQTTYVFPAYRRYVTPPRTFGVNLELSF